MDSTPLLEMLTIQILYIGSCSSTTNPCNNNKAAKPQLLISLHHHLRLLSSSSLSRMIKAKRVGQGRVKVRAVMHGSVLVAADHSCL
jgi:hypothetical protein